MILVQLSSESDGYHVYTGRHIDVGDLVDFGVQAIFQLVTDTLGALGACLPCDIAGSCITCFAANAPIPPSIPTNLFD